MPSNQQAMAYFDCFFANIHPYVPVVDRQYFYQQWHSNKYSISPLILEGMFACSSHLMNKPEDGARWLALAARKFYAREIKEINLDLTIFKGTKRAIKKLQG